MLEAEYDITEMAHNTRRTQGDEYLAVRFFLAPKQDTAASEKAGRPIYKDAEFIEIMQPGNKENIICRVATDDDKSRFAKHYAAWKARTGDDGEQIVGTPLAEWPGITRGQVEELSFFHVKTVEQLANLADNASINMFGLQALKEKASRYLQAAEDSGSLEQMAELKQTNAAQQARIDAMEEQIRKLIGREGDDVSHETPETSPEEPPVKPKRKRRTKKEMEAARAAGEK